MASTDGTGGGAEALAGGAVDVERGEAPLGVAAVELQVGFDQGVQQRTVLGPQGALLGEQRGQGLARRGGPGGEGQDELVAGDQGVLQREQSEEQVARGVVTS